MESVNDDFERISINMYEDLKEWKEYIGEVNRIFLKIL